MDSKPPLQGRPLRRKVHVVYYLSRGGGQLDHPHLLEGYLSAAQDGLRLRDFKRWLAVLRGKSMPTSFAWSYKRSYKNGFIWHDLGDNDLIQPLSKNEYVLMGSEIKEQGGNVARCKCGAIQQQTETKVVTAVDDIQQEPSSNKPGLTRSPKPITKNGSYGAEDYRSVGGLSPGIVSSPMSRLGLIATENKFHDNGTARTMNKSSLYRAGGGSSRSFNDLTAQRLLEEVKKPTINHHDTKQLVALKSSNNTSHTRQNSKMSIRNCEIIAEEDREIDEGARRDTANHGQANLTSTYVNQATFTSKLRGAHYKDGINQELYKSDGVSSDDHDNEDDINGIFIMDAATQTGDSTRCSTEDHQDGINAADYTNMLEVVHSPGESARLSAARRVSSARYNSSHTHGHAVTGNLSVHISQDFSNSPDVDNSMMIHRQPSETHGIQNVGNASLSNHTSLQNHMGSPGAMSSCSAMSARSSTRFAREENNRTPLPATSSKPTRKYHAKPEHHHHHQHHHQHSKGTSSQSSSGNIGATASLSTSHTLLKQLLTCGNADVVSEKKPNNVTDNVMVINNNALSGLQTPARVISNTAYNMEADKSKNALWAVCKPAGLMKRMGSNTAPSSDNRSVISATATSEQGSMRDMLEMVSSPESMCASNCHLKSNMMKAHSFSASSAAAALQSQSDLRVSHGASHSGTSVSRRILQQMPSAVGPAAGNTSPGVFSVASSRSSIRDNEVTRMEGGDVEEGFHEALRSHHIGLKNSSKSRASKGNKNTLLKKGDLDTKEASHCNEGLRTNRTNVKTESNTHSTSVSELHKLICNPSGTPPCVNHNKVASSNSIAPQACSYNYSQAYTNNNSKESYTPQHIKSHEILITTHGHSRTTPTSSNFNSPNISILSKSLNSPSSLMLERRVHASSTPSSHLTSWKDLLWSPRNNFPQKEKERRHMKP